MFRGLDRMPRNFAQPEQAMAAALGD